jgi:alkylmercury lyase-like protein
VNRVTDVRVEMYRSFIDEQRAPETREIADRLRIPPGAVVSALRDLAEDDVIAYMPGTEDVWLVHPFCATTAPFKVKVDERHWDAICVWDALGILALLKSDGSVSTSCPDCGEPIVLEVVDGEVVASPGFLVHLGVPASRWYEDIGFT